ncbi:hypothetical protein F53441_12511 [Fusarium austroafricanum]|uniref:DUF7136 domain-containing protein n=1 Tax=Fusarium austroafricanum TaxID=2364996 RepID=A0A8H4JWN3_9HYPO|nr:hypothetical protein F53441_12511 [Fusarium austroafricanum]
MRCLLSLACWFFVLCISSGAAEEQQHDSTGTLEIDLVFPRNETYSPTPMFPLVFSYRNPQLIPLLRPFILYQIWDYNDMGKSISNSYVEIPSINVSTVNDTHFEYHLLRKFDQEGKWFLVINFMWYNCFEDPHGISGNKYTIRENDTSASFVFTTKGPSKHIDLVAATSNKNCSSPAGVAIKLQDTVKTPQSDDLKAEVGELCPLDPTATEADKCDVTMDLSSASSISAGMTSEVCRYNLTRPEGVDCESLKEKESVGMRIVFGGTTCLAFILGALGYIL